MMETMQIGPVPFGPLPPGSVSGHGNDVARGIGGLQDIFSKTKSIDLAAKEGAQNTLTDLQEFKWGDVFMTFNYQYKKGKLLANGRPIEDINDANNIGGDRMGRVMNALNRLVADKDINEAIVVSEDLGYGRHFIYRYRKGEDNNIEGLAFEYQGNMEELNSVMGELGSRAVNNGEFENKSIDFSKPLFFTDENKNSVKDLAAAADNSFRSGERRRDVKKYLARLNRDTQGFDHLMQKRKIQEEELVKQFKEIILSNPDAKAGIAAAIYASIDIAKKMDVNERRRREEIQPVVYEQTINTFSKDARNKVRTFSDGVSIASKITKQERSSTTQNDKVNNIFEKSKEEVDIEKKTAQQIIEPVISAIIGLSTVIITLPTENLLENQRIEFQAEANQSVISKGGSSPNEIFWQGIILGIFELDDQRDIRTNEILSDGSRSQLEKPSNNNVILVSETHPGSQWDSGQARITTEIIPLKLDEERTSFQIRLEVLAGLIKDHERNNIVVQPEEEVKQKILEHDIVTLGKELFGVLIIDENKPQIDTLGKIAFLLRVYEDPNSSELVKSIIAALIYKQVDIIRKDKEILGRFPQFETTFKKFEYFSSQSKFLEERYNRLLFVLARLFSHEYIHKGIYNDQNLLRRLIFLIFYLSESTQNDFSFEILPRQGALKPNKVLIKQSNLNKKQFYKRTKSGILFWLSSQVIYQYCPLQYLSALD